jgi:uncharacterized protein involved in exopolysaccharide biosynthesis
MQTQKKEINLQYLLGRIVGQKHLIVIPVVAALVLSVVAAFSLPKKYEAYSMILLDKQKIADPLTTTAVVPTLQDEMDVLSKQLYSWPRLLRLVTELHLADSISNPQQLHDFMEVFKKRIKLEFATKDLIKISYRDSDPDVAYKVVTHIVRGIVNDSSLQKKEDAHNAIVFFTEQLKIYKQKLELSEWNFTASKVESELRLAQNRKRLLEAKMKTIQKMVPTQITREQNPLLVKLRQQLANAQDEMARLMIDGKEDNPWIIQLRQKSNFLVKKISEEEQQDTVKESISFMNPLYMQTEQDIKQADMEVEYLSKRKMELEGTDGY